MIPERLSQSIANCRTWLACRAGPASGRISRTRGCRRGTRPELFVLEDRCLLTTASYVISNSAIAFDKSPRAFQGRPRRSDRICFDHTCPVKSRYRHGDKRRCRVSIQRDWLRNDNADSSLQ